MKISKNFIFCTIFVIIYFFAGFNVPNFMVILLMTQKQPVLWQILLASVSFVICILNFVFILPKIKYVRFLMYPLSVLALFNWVEGFSFLLKNFAIHISLSLIFVPLITVAYIWGLIKDIDDVKRDYKEGNIFATILFFIISFVAVLYVTFIISPFGGKYIFHANRLKSFVPIYMWMTIPAYVLYVCFCRWVFDKLCKVRSIAYPFMAFNLYFGLLYCILSGGGIVHGAVLFAIVILTLVILLPIMLGAFVLGGIQDLQERQKLEAENKEISL